MKSEALKSLSGVIPEQHAILAITWFANEIDLLAIRRDAVEYDLAISGASPEAVTAWHEATNDLHTLAHAMDWSLAEPGGGDKC